MKLRNHFNREELMLERVIKRAIMEAKTTEEIEEAKQCMGHLMKHVLNRAKQNMNSECKE
jgi:hypothetical protein